MQWSAQAVLYAALSGLPPPEGDRPGQGQANSGADGVES
jgi:hypothetical protein